VKNAPAAPRRAINVAFIVLTTVGATLSFRLGHALMALVVPAIFAVVWFVLPRNAYWLPRRWVILLTALMFTSILPTSIGATLQVLVLVGAFGEWIFGSRERRGSTLVFALTFLTVFYWALLIFHPNVQEVTTGILGFRKSVLALGGLVLGCAIPSNQRLSAERQVAALLIIALSVSIIGHLWVPAIPELVERGTADIYTSLYGTEQRMEGIFAGPFHAAAAGVLLTGWALVRWKTGGWLAKVGMFIGLFGTYLTLVRAAYVAVILCVIALILMSGSISSFAKRVTGLAAIGIVIVVVAESLGLRVLDMGGTILDYDSDNRFLNRLPGYTQGIQMLGESPFIGWGAGSAGDTLDGAFSQGDHLTSHNLVLKMLVEGGLLGGLLWLALLIAVWKRLDRRSPSGQLAVISLVGLLAFGLTGSAIEALPVTYFLMMLVGLGLQSKVLPMKRTPFTELHIHNRTAVPGSP
jgi:O-antigen ligase